MHTTLHRIRGNASSDISTACLESKLREGLPSIDELKRLGDRRMGACSGIAKFPYGALRVLVRSFLNSDNSMPLR
ncbi:hypothetical protein [Pseudomonas caricapapayae]|nr:hypothetical protein [Pseudomonas caricapapayae]